MKIPPALLLSALLLPAVLTQFPFLAPDDWSLPTPTRSAQKD